MDVAVRLAGSKDKPRLRTLLGDCLAELGTFGEVDETYPYFDAYWDEGEARWPYLVHAGDEPVGFAFVNCWSPSGRGADYSMAEFFILPAARGHGCGTNAAVSVFHAHSGVWELAIMPLNIPAKRFWPRAIAAAGGEGLEKLESGRETIYRFVIPDRTDRAST